MQSAAIRLQANPLDDDGHRRDGARVGRSGTSGSGPTQPGGILARAAAAARDLDDDEGGPP